MILKIRFGKWRLTMTIAPVIDVVGVNSLLPDGNHILMWDFDDMAECCVVSALTCVQLLYDLPSIYILNTGKPNSHIAYCFKKVDWRTAVEIIASTPGVCYNYFKWGVFRKRFTLRVSPKCGRVPFLISILSSPRREDCTVDELRSWVQYETLSDRRAGPIFKIGER